MSNLISFKNMSFKVWPSHIEGILSQPALLSDPLSMQDFCSLLRQTKKDKPLKLLLGVPASCNLPEVSFDYLLTFLNNHFAQRFLFVPVAEDTDWGSTWETIIAQNFPVAQWTAGRQWVRQSELKGQIRPVRLGEQVYYLKLAGQIATPEGLSKLQRLVKQILARVKLKGKYLTHPLPQKSEHGTIWVPVEGALIIDCAEVFHITAEFATSLQAALQEYALTAQSGGLYFITAGKFQDWLLQKYLASPVRPAANILRILPLTDSDYTAIVKLEASKITKTIIQDQLPVPLLIHQAQGMQAAYRISRRYFIDLVIAEGELSEKQRKMICGSSPASALLKITPSQGSELAISKPGELSAAYDVDYFAQQVCQAYRNQRGQDVQHWQVQFTPSRTRLLKGSKIFSVQAQQYLSPQALQLHRAILRFLLSQASFAEEPSNFELELQNGQLQKIGNTFSCTKDQILAILQTEAEELRSYCKIFEPPLATFLGRFAIAGQLEVNLISCELVIVVSAAEMHVRFSRTKEGRLLELQIHPRQLDDRKIAELIDGVWLDSMPFPHLRRFLVKAFCGFQKRAVVLGPAEQMIQFTCRHSSELSKFELISFTGERLSLKIWSDRYRYSAKIPAKAWRLEVFKNLHHDFYNASEAWTSGCYDIISIALQADQMSKMQGLFNYVFNYEQSVWLTSILAPQEMFSNLLQRITGRGKGVDRAFVQREGKQLLLKKELRPPRAVARSKTIAATAAQSRASSFTKTQIRNIDEFEIKEQKPPEAIATVEDLIKEMPPRKQSTSTRFLTAFLRIKKPQNDKKNLLKHIDTCLKNDRRWNFFGAKRFWMCPFCGIPGADLKRKAPPLREQIYHHLTAVCQYRQEALTTRKMLTYQVIEEQSFLISLREMIINIPQWQLRDEEGICYCAYCGRSTGIRAPQNPADMKFVVTVAKHLKSCPGWRGGEGIPLASRIIQQNIQHDSQRKKLGQQVAAWVVQDPRWQCKSAHDNWICPFCLEVTQINVGTPIVLKFTAPSHIAEHLITACTHYKSGKGTLVTLEQLQAKVAQTPKSVATSSKGMKTSSEQNELKRSRERIRTLSAQLDHVKQKSSLKQEELLEAQKFQQWMLPDIPKITGLEFECFYRPCTGISGDFYDFIELGHDLLGIVIGDVTGHGVGAGMMMTIGKKLIALASKGRRSPRDILIVANRELKQDMPPGTFISVIYGVLHKTNRVFTFVRAGHNPPILYNARRKPPLKIYNPPGMILGSAQDNIFAGSLQEQPVELIPGDLLVLYTDGLFEVMNPQGQVFGLQNFYRLVKTHGQLPLQEFCPKISNYLLAYTQRNEPQDDMTMVALRVHALPKSRSPKLVPNMHTKQM